ncbi:histidine kinase [Streptomyces caelestis]|uniref:histidine kinase n=2 Tax=Streptomyces TaxID=1883 RepID=A0A0M8QR38_9ACTN|nr:MULTISPECIES: histidine kinase [Streptomyces]KOT37602.1 histidine kinase [Streptomyces caelestis]KOV23025.1 histidine kinase [Streptomyces sp. XY152]
MVRLLRPFARAVTYTRWLHLFIAAVWPTVWILVVDSWVPASVGVLALVGLVPTMRTVEGVQAAGLLLGQRYGAQDAEIVPTPSATWADRGRTVVWLQCRLLLGCAVSFLTVHLPMLAVDLANTARGGPADPSTFVRVSGHHWWHMLLVPLPLLVLAAVVVAAGGLMTALARPLLGPSPAERLAALEARTDRLLERNRIAHELHDSIGHALTVAVVQAGAARTAGDPGFTDRALAAIEETGRAALEDLERVLGVLREPDKPVSSRPTLVDADRLLESARASGAKVDADVTGPLDTVPGPVSREGYRILQESLTNALRHAGAVPVRVGVRVAGGTLLLEVRNPLTEAVPGPGRGSGLRGIRERAALLGGRAWTGPDEGDWRVRVELPTG